VHIGALLLLIGTFWPVIGLALVALLALATHGRLRVWILFLGPLLAMVPCWLFGAQIAYNGNLLFAALFGFAVIALVIYYPVLAIAVLIIYVRKRKAGAG